MGLREELATISGRKKRFLLLRMIDVSAEVARQLCSINKGTYNNWLHNPAFVALYRRKGELSAEYKDEALKLLRRGNQLNAILLEEKVINKIKDEIDSGQYDLIKTNLAREVYSKLMSDLDYQPKSLALTWEQRVQQLQTAQEPAQITEGAVEGEIIPETTGEPEAEHPESQLLTESEQRSPQPQEEVQT